MKWTPRYCFLAVALFWPGLKLPAQVVINEIHYEPTDNTVREEFVELLNTSTEPVDVSGWYFSSGLDYVIPTPTSIEPGGYLVIAQDPETLEDRLGFREALGPYEGRLDNDGERLVLRDGEHALIDEVDYNVGFPWPLSSAGEGSSIELIHPSLDNDLGGSWRPSGLRPRPAVERLFYITAEDPEWHYRKATSEPSDPASAWRATDFAEDETWLVGQTSIGFGDEDDNTVLDDMKGNYSGVYLRHNFTIPSVEEIPGDLKLALFSDDGAIVWINGTEVARVRAGEEEPPTYEGRARGTTEAQWESMFLDDPTAYLVEGANVIAIHALNISASSNDFSIDAQLFRPGSQDFEEVTLAPPTPGARNTVHTDNAPPQIRQVNHLPPQPLAREANLVSCRVTDPDGVQSVHLDYQVVAPGEYVPAFFPVPLPELIRNANTPRPPNPEFEEPANWTRVIMVDDGTSGDVEADDGTYSAVIRGVSNRTLVRYRITAADRLEATVRVPFLDDPTLNFAYFVYDGVPDYAASTSIAGGPTVHAADALSSAPVYMLLTREQDVIECIAANPAQQIQQGNQARFAENWEGTFVYDGFVYDHITFRLRGANGRYQVPSGNGSTAGKRHWRFKFNKGNHLRARDKWGHRHRTRWRVLNTGRMFGNRIDGNWGLNDQVNDIIWRAYGVPAAFGHAFHFRVVDDAEEAPAGGTGQYLGDFWGIARAFENYDVRFLEAHDLPKGNLYKLVNQTQNAKEQQRYQAPDAVSNGLDHNTIEGSLRAGRPDSWLLAHVNYEKWYHYHAIVQAIRHYDYWPSANKNATWYFEPIYTEDNSFLGRMWTLPFDADATWGPTWNDGRDRPYDAIFSGGGKPEFQKDYRNHIREVHDLLWQREQLEQVVRQTAAFMDPLEEADIDRWRNAPPQAGRQYFGAANQRDLEGKVADMLRFAFNGGSWPGGSVGGGGRAAFLDSLIRRDDSSIPTTPTIAYGGLPEYPLDALTFRVSSFEDPQGNETFDALKWRVAEISPLENPGSIPLDDPVWKIEPVRLEIEAVWESEDLPTLQDEISIPFEFLEEGRTYRVRARTKDSSDYWSHWSAPIEFTTGAPTTPFAEVEDLRITEIMYNPLGGSDFEFIELQNKGERTLDLSKVAFADGVEFDFAESSIQRLEPGAFIVVVKNLDVFSTRYDTTGMLIAGSYTGRLDNGGERIAVRFGRVTEFMDFSYLDSWYPETDGLGVSLNIVDSGLPPATWNDGESWFPSSMLYGTPGDADPGDADAGFIRPGDASRDGRLDIIDGLVFLRLLFEPETTPPPCAGDTVLDGSNVPLLDVNGDRRVDLSDAVNLLTHLFLRGPAHAAGTECIRLEGCPSVCAAP